MKDTHILVVDDSMVIRELVKHVLGEESYVVWTAASGEEGLDLIGKRGLPHLAIVDINMPGMDGFSFCEQVHRYSDLPVIMLSSEGSEDTVVKGLKNHAEDYIIKPSSGPLRAQELIARVQSVLTRMGDFDYTLEPVVTIDETMKIDFPGRCVFINGKPINLTPTETKLMYILIHHAGRALTYSYLLRRLWPLEEVFEDRLHTHVYRLRKKIEEKPREPVYILSNWGKGYSFKSKSPS